MCSTDVSGNGRPRVRIQFGGDLELEICCIFAAFFLSLIVVNFREERSISDRMAWILTTVYYLVNLTKLLERKESSGLFCTLFVADLAHRVINP